MTARAALGWLGLALALGVGGGVALRPAPALAQLYEWTDDRGERHLTDDPNKVPEEYRGRVRQRTPAPRPAAPAAPPGLSPEPRREGAAPPPARAQRLRFTVKEPPPDWVRVRGPGVATWRDTRTGAGIHIEAHAVTDFPSQLTDTTLSEMVVAVLPIVVRAATKGRMTATVVSHGPMALEGKRLYQAVMNLRASVTEEMGVSGRAVMYLLWTPDAVYAFTLAAPLGAYDGGHVVLLDLVRTFTPS